MFLKEFNPSSKQRITKLNKFLKEEFNISFKTAGIPSKNKLTEIVNHSEKAIAKIKSSKLQFQIEPEYAKYLGIRDIANTMINEGYYAESPAYESMCSEVKETVKNLMDSGYTMDEACGECMNRYRMDNRFAYDDEHVLPIVITAAKDYMESCGSKHESVEEDITETPETDLNENLLRELAKECGVELDNTTSYDAIEEKLNAFAEVAGKSRDAVVGFLNGLDEEALVAGIQMFGRKIGEANAFVKARKDAIKAGKKKFTVGNKEFDVTGDTSDEEVDESMMFDDIIADLLNEEVNVEEAEVVMAVRALADDIQDQVERLGRMVNEDVPAIADQIRGEMGAQAAQAFADSVTGVLTTYMESAKTAKAGMDNATGTLSGDAPATTDVGLGDTGELDAPADDLGLEEPDIDVNEPAAAGPEEEPLGRAPVEV